MLSAALQQSLMDPCCTEGHVERLPQLKGGEGLLLVGLVNVLLIVFIIPILHKENQSDQALLHEA